MVCINCDYQWCWICEEEYKSDHYLVGKCRGLQDVDVNDFDDIVKYRNCFGLHKIFVCIFPPIYGPINFDVSIGMKYLIILIFWLLGYGFLFFYILTFNIFNQEGKFNFKSEARKGFFALIILLLVLVLLVPFQLFFTCTVTPFILISLVYHKFFDILLMFYGIGSVGEDF